MMSGVDARRVTADDGTALAATVREGAGPTVVCAHGWALSARSWDPVRRLLHLLGDARTIGYDQRHHGRSGRGERAPSIDLLGTDLRRVLDELVPTGRMVLAGHSMGGMTIMALAAADPEFVARRVAGVALVSTSAGDLHRSPALSRMAGWPSVVEVLLRLSAPLGRRAAYRMLFGPSAAPETVAATAREIRATGARAICEFWPALTAHDKADALDALSTVPVEVLVGDRDLLTPARHSRLLAERIAGARLTVVPGAGHMLTSEQPELLARTLLRLPATTAEPAPGSPTATADPTTTTTDEVNRAQSTA